DLLGPFSLAYIKGWRRSICFLICLEAVRYQYQKFSLLVRAYEEWHNASLIMRAFSIGEKEALAVSNLQERISPEVTAALRAEVRPRGMRRWLSHEILAKNLFNRGFSSGTGCWDVKLFLQRLTGDWDRQPVELRKTWSLKDAQSLHGACGFFLHVMGELESQVARSDFDDCKDAILSQFMTGFSDPEIDHLLQTTVPPVELRDISFLKNVVVAFEARTQKEVEAKEAEAAARVAEATLEHLKVKLNKDLEVLRARVSTPEHEAHEALKDQAYLRDRNGQQWTRDWLETHCKLIPVDQSMNSAMPEIGRFLSRDGLASGGLDILTNTSVTYSKPNSAGNDKRKLAQQALFLTTANTQSENVWTASSAWVSQTLGPVPLIKISDMIGYDSIVKWGGLWCSAFLSTRFVAGTAQYQELKAFKDEVVALYPDAASTSAERIVAGTGEAETNCLPWRLADDLSLVISTERKLLSLADFIHQQVTIHGLADFELRDHMLSAKQLPP
ncbi:unnamed protein product, partial [Durusdinium trenchii]